MLIDSIQITLGVGRVINKDFASFLSKDKKTMSIKTKQFILDYDCFEIYTLTTPTRKFSWFEYITLKKYMSNEINFPLP